MYNGIFDPALTGVLSVPTRTGIDPATAGVLSMGLGLLGTNGGPRAAGSFGNALGQAGMQGLQSYAVADQQRRENQRADALVALERAKTMSTLQQAALAKDANERQQAFWQRFLASMQPGGAAAPQQGQPAAQYDAGSGQFVSSPTPPQAQATAAPGNRFNISPQMVVAGMPAGVNLLDMYKAGQPKIKIENGYIIDENTGNVMGTLPQTNQQGFSTQTVPDGRGGWQVQVTPGAERSYGTQQRIGAEATARLDPYKIEPTAPNQPPRVMSRYDVLNQQAAQAPGRITIQGPGVNLQNVTSDQVMALIREDPKAAEIISQAMRGTQPQGVQVGMSPADQAAQKAREVFESDAAKGEADLAKELRTQADSANKSLVNYQYQQRLIRDGMFGGKLAPGIQGAAEFINGLGIPIGEDAMQNTQKFKKLAEEGALSQIKMFVGSQNISDADRKAVESIVARIQDDPQARIEYLDFLTHRAEQAIKKNSAAEAYAKENSRLRGFNYEYEPFKPKTQASQKYEDWISQAQRANPSMSRGAIIQEGVRRGRLPQGYK